MIFQTSRSIATDSLMLLFTQYKTSWLTAISSHCLAVLPDRLPTRLRSFNNHMRQNILPSLSWSEPL